MIKLIPKEFHFINFNYESIDQFLILGFQKLNFSTYSVLYFRNKEEKQ